MKGVNPKLFNILLLYLPLQFSGVYCVNWLEWWTYDGISGPSFWGLINPEWALCNQGQRQSPVDIEPKLVLYDPQLPDLYITPSKVRGKVVNTGHTVSFLVEPGNRHLVNVSGASLSYNYQVWQIDLHWGDEGPGSEHTIGGKQFDGELQIIGYNGELYSKEKDALSSPQGVVGIAVLLKEGEITNLELEKLIDGAGKIKYAGDEEPLSDLQLTKLLPATTEFVTYEGSLTKPGCQESVVWIIPNKPIYLTKRQREHLKLLMQGTKEDQRGPLAGNFRPEQGLNGRLIRTNINLNKRKDAECEMNPLFHFEANK
ncbi:carbonic anhydrase-related protein 10 [Eurytemora carolleeae]|uniref:carbonic anhydrase-related protein 10 n=1 Tax=Eurytemora carolleeae TaxID=1294199 RepID=UPI000C762005|nr:carbonic anhydrase-related protein 10 [Eurytemora carolleeae]|eukprot:XP_023339786.1 carbonic anhydrase-related protein 10-like [Eurytemora affinis]